LYPLLSNTIISFFSNSHPLSMMTSCSTLGLSTYEVLLRNLLVVGKWRKYVQVKSPFH
jgi:hypothetical protein